MNVTYKKMQNNCYSIFDENDNELKSNNISISEVFAACNRNNWILKR